MFKIKRKKRALSATDRLTLSPVLRGVIAEWLVDRGYEDPAYEIQRGELMDLVLHMNLSTATRLELAAALQRTLIPAKFPLARVPVNLTCFVIRLAHDGMLVPGSPFDAERTRHEKSGPFSTER